MKLDGNQRRDLLGHLQSLSRDADAEPILPVFLPLPAHDAVFDPRKFVIRGERGAGKTALFKLLRELAEKSIPLERVFPQAASIAGRWVEGFSESEAKHPATPVLDQFGQGVDDTTLRAFWLGHMAGVLSEAFPEVTAPGGNFIDAWRKRQTEPITWVRFAEDEIGAIASWLDRMDEYCVQRNTWLFVSYDHLDKIGVHSLEVRLRYASTLLSLWLSLTNRYQRIRGKIFLREDLFQSAMGAATDASKLESRSASLQWNSQELYRLVIRHFCAFEGLRTWLQSAAKTFPLQEREHLGWLPPDALPEEGDVSQQGFADHLVGKTMGAGVNKGYTHRWMINHLQDAHKRLVPRSMLNLLAFAAQAALNRGPKAEGSRLLHPSELQAALERTSQHRALEMKEEHPVVQRLTNLSGMVLFLDRAEVVRALKTAPPKGHDDGFRADGEAAFEELQRLGVLKLRPDGRVDIPDIYRYGFGIKRKGGVARPR